MRPAPNYAKTRDAEYAAMLQSHKESRAELHERQDEGLTSPYLLDLVAERHAREARPAEIHAPEARTQAPQ